MQDKNGKLMQLDMHTDAWWIRALGDELSVDENIRWELHLEQCAECRIQWQAMMAVDSLFEEPMPVPQLDMSFTKETVQKITDKQRLRRILRVIGGTLIVSMVTLLVFSMVTSAFTTMEQGMRVAYSARHLLFSALLDTVVSLVVSWQAVLPLALGGALIAFAILVPNGILAAFLYSRRRRRAAMAAVLA